MHKVMSNELRTFERNCSAFVNPVFHVNSLTVGTVFVTAEIAVKLRVSAVGTVGNVVPQKTCFTWNSRRIRVKLT